MSREGVPLVVIQRQLGHAELGVTSVYLRGIDNPEIVHAVHERQAPMIPAANGLRLPRWAKPARGRAVWRGPLEQVQAEGFSIELLERSKLGLVERLVARKPGPGWAGNSSRRPRSDWCSGGERNLGARPAAK
jgi:hypothetical protein